MNLRASSPFSTGMGMQPLSTRAAWLLPALLILAGLAHAPAAHATLNCLALPTGKVRLERRGSWTPVAGYYDVPVGGAITEILLALNTRVQKSGSISESIWLESRLDLASSNTGFIGAPVFGSPISDIFLLGLATRFTVMDTHNGGTTILTSQTPVPTGQLNMTTTQTVDHVQLIRVEIVRTHETLPPGTQWRMWPTTILGATAWFELRGSTTLASAEIYCPNVPIAYFLDLSIPALPPEPPPPPLPPVTCTLNGGRELVVTLGKVQISALHTIGQPPEGYAKRETTLSYACRNTATANPPYSLAIQGSAAAHAPALRSDKDGVGVILENASGTVVPVNSGRFAVPNAGQSGGSSIRFYSYPTRVDGSRIDAGPFKATATLRINIQ